MFLDCTVSLVGLHTLEFWTAQIGWTGRLEKAIRPGISVSVKNCMRVVHGTVTSVCDVKYHTRPITIASATNRHALDAKKTKLKIHKSDGSI